MVLPATAEATPGDLDPTFGTGGEVFTSVGGGGIAYSIALQPDGRIVAAGSAFVGDNEFLILRYVKLPRFRGGVNAFASVHRGVAPLVVDG